MSHSFCCHFPLTSYHYYVMCLTAYKHKTHAATKDEILDAHVRIDVEWNNYNPGNGNISQTGFFFVEVKGTIIRMPDIDPFFYAPKNLVANYNYQDRGVYVRPPGRCPELYSEQKGSGAVRILHTDEVEDPTKDGQLSVMAGPGWEQSLLLLKELQSKGRTSARQKPIDKELKTDVYQFVLTVPMATTLKQQSTPCSRYDAQSKGLGSLRDHIGQRGYLVCFGDSIKDIPVETHPQFLRGLC